MAGNNVFAVPVFLVVFRESLEAVIIVSILLAFIKQTMGGPDGDPIAYKKLRRQVCLYPTLTNASPPPPTTNTISQVWLGSLIGFLICMIVASAIIGIFYTVGRSSWAQNGLYYEGAFSLFGSIIITIMGAALLRVTKMQDKWRVKLAKAVDNPLRVGGRHGIVKRFFEKYAMFVLPFVTVLREGIEAVVFVAGVSFTAPATAFPLPVVCGLAVGGIVGYLLYRYVFPCPSPLAGPFNYSYTPTNTLQWWCRYQAPGLPRHLHLPPLPRRRRPLLPRRLGL